MQKKKVAKFSGFFSPFFFGWKSLKTCRNAKTKIQIFFQNGRHSGHIGFSSVLAEDGTLLNVSESVLKQIRAFYTQLYWGKSADAGACGALWSSLPVASVEE